MAGSLGDRLDERIRRDGPIPVSAYVEAALYEPDDGFYTRGGPEGPGHAGRRGDFLTSPEVGPLFGAVVARAVDACWEELGRPDPFTVIDWGAGPGTLARAMLAVDPVPEVRAQGALRLVLVERSTPQRASHPDHDLVASRADPPTTSVGAGMVIANELLDNLPFDVVEARDGQWVPVVVGGRDGDGRFSLVVQGPPDTRLDPPGPAVGEGTRVPVQTEARTCLAQARRLLDRGRVVVFDYGDTTATLAARTDDRGEPAWLRTHVGHDGGADWRREPGSCDITTDLAIDQLQVDATASRHRRQDDWLRAHGIDALVEEGRRQWSSSAGVGDLAALRARSRIREADALLDPDGMGAFHVLEWDVAPK